MWNVTMILAIVGWSVGQLVGWQFASSIACFDGITNLAGAFDIGQWINGVKKRGFIFITVLYKLCTTKREQFIRMNN